MSDFTPQSLCLLGRQPQLGLAELESLYGAACVRPFGQHALLDIATDEINFKRLGGTIKVARVLNMDVGKTWRDVENYMLKNSPTHIARMPETKITVGISAYGIKTTPSQVNATGLKVKKLIRQSGRPARIVPNKELNLSSAQVLHNKLTTRGGWELVFASNGRQIILAQTLFVQDIEAYAARDQARPARDARVGMLPPKLAQIMINLAVGQLPKDAAASRVRVLDPFCGTGVVLQEAMLMGFHALGTDLEPRMVDYTKENLTWLVKRYPEVEAFVSVEQADATSAKWPAFTVVVSETYLGRPLNSPPPPDKLKEIVNDVNTILTKFLKNLAPQLKTGRPICLAVPAWRKPSGDFISLPLIDQIDALGYNKVDFAAALGNGLVYFRENQTVARQLLVLTKQ